MRSSGRCRRPRLGWAGASTAIPLAALAATLLLAACGSTEPGPTGVTLVPVPGGSSRVWRWTADCPLRPAARNGCGKAGPTLGFGQLDGDAWNLGGPADAGALAMSTDPSGAVTIEGDFDRTPPCTDSACIAPRAYTWVRAYPNVLYGIDQCHAGTSPQPSPRLPLPLRLDALPPHLTGVTAYAADTSRVTYDVTYDMWLNPTGTKRPCRSEGTLEILIMTDYDTRALLPAEMKVGTTNIPAEVGRAGRPGREPWTVYAANIGRDGHTAPWGGTLWFVPGRDDVVHRGRVSVDIGAALSEASRLLHDQYGWPEPVRHYWLDTVSFGVEFGPASGNPLDTGSSHFSVRLSAYCLDARKNADCN